jgi:hypothetical protein
VHLARSRWQVFSVRGNDVAKSLLEMRDQFHVPGEKELIDRGHLREAITALEEDAGVAREASRIAGDGSHFRNAGCCKLARLRLCTLPRRIEHDCFERFEFGAPQRIPKQITLLRRDRL